MSCGCGCNQTEVGTTAVFMCLACPHARATKFVSCSITGRPIVRKECGGVLVAEANTFGHWGAPENRHWGVCPIGRTPDDRGRVRWLGMLWRGVPLPLKIMLTDATLCGLIGHDRPARWRRIPGCACIDRLKTVMERVYAAMGWSERDAWIALHDTEESRKTA